MTQIGLMGTRYLKVTFQSTLAATAKLLLEQHQRITDAQLTEHPTLLATTTGDFTESLRTKPEVSVQEFHADLFKPDIYCQHCLLMSTKKLIYARNRLFPGHSILSRRIAVCLIVVRLLYEHNKGIGTMHGGKTRRCEEVQKASTVFPYGLTSAEHRKHEHMQVTVVYPRCHQARVQAKIHETCFCTMVTLLRGNCPYSLEPAVPEPTPDLSTAADSFSVNLI
ncbi:uncharacterized protein V6R79_026192 [Siganus canaliculatus]